MNYKTYAASVFLALFSGQVPAQDDALTAEQQEAIRLIAEEVGEACVMPAGPAIPDGNTASEEVMLSTQQAMKGYLEEGNTYLGCLEEVESGWGEDITDNQAAVVNFLYNRMVSDLQSGAEAFNTELGVYRERSGD